MHVPSCNGSTHCTYTEASAPLVLHFVSVFTSQGAYITTFGRNGLEEGNSITFTGSVLTVVIL